MRAAATTRHRSRSRPSRLPRVSFRHVRCGSSGSGPQTTRQSCRRTGIALAGISRCGGSSRFAEASRPRCGLRTSSASASRTGPRATSTSRTSAVDSRPASQGSRRSSILVSRKLDQRAESAEGVRAGLRREALALERCGEPSHILARDLTHGRRAEEVDDVDPQPIGVRLDRRQVASSRAPGGDQRLADLGGRPSPLLRRALRLVASATPEQKRLAGDELK